MSLKWTADFNCLELRLRSTGLYCKLSGRILRLRTTGLSIPRHRRKRNNPLAIPRQIIALNFTARLNLTFRLHLVRISLNFTARRNCAVQQYSIINIYGDKRMTSLRRVNRRATLSAEQSAPTTEAWRHSTARSSNGVGLVLATPRASLIPQHAGSPVVVPSIAMQPNWAPVHLTETQLICNTSPYPT